MFAKHQSQRVLERVSDRLLESLSDVLHDALIEALAARGGKPRHSIIRRGAVAVGTVTALTAGSAGISTLRRSQDASERA